jgi:hypothetical protein
MCCLLSARPSDDHRRRNVTARNSAHAYLRLGVGNVQIVQSDVLDHFLLFVDVALGQWYVLLSLEVKLGGKRIGAALALQASACWQEYCSRSPDTLVRVQMTTGRKHRVGVWFHLDGAAVSLDVDDIAHRDLLLLQRFVDGRVKLRL